MRGLDPFRGWAKWAVHVSAGQEWRHSRTCTTVRGNLCHSL